MKNIISEKKLILLAGGFHKVKSLALSLIRKGYRIIVINKNYADCHSLAQIQALEVIYGDASKPFVLEEAGADRVDIAIALTQNDEDNLVICELCKKKFLVEKTVALVSDPKKTEFFYKMGIDSVVCAINVVAGIIEQQAFMDEMATRIPLGSGKVGITEVYISQAAPAAKKKIWELDLPRDTIIGCILRGGGKHDSPRGQQDISRGYPGDDFAYGSGKGSDPQAHRKIKNAGRYPKVRKSCRKKRKKTVENRKKR